MLVLESSKNKKKNRNLIYFLVLINQVSSLFLPLSFKFIIIITLGNEPPDIATVKNPVEFSESLSRKKVPSEFAISSVLVKTAICAILMSGKCILLFLVLIR